MAINSFKKEKKSKSIDKTKRDLTPHQQKLLSNIKEIEIDYNQNNLSPQKAIKQIKNKVLQQIKSEKRSLSKIEKKLYHQSQKANRKDNSKKSEKKSEKRKKILNKMDRYTDIQKKCERLINQIKTNHNIKMTLTHT